MKFADVVQQPDVLAVGRARETVSIEIAHKATPIDLRVLTPVEWATALQFAHKYALEQGVTDPSDGDDIYELGFEIAVLAAACIDHDSPKDKPAHFFAHTGEILQADFLTREIIALLYAHYVQLDEQTSQRIMRLNDAEFFQLVKRSAGGDHLPFCDLRPGTQFSAFRTLAGLYMTLLQVSSSSSESSASTTTKSRRSKKR